MSNTLEVASLFSSTSFEVYFSYNNTLYLKSGDKTQALLNDIPCNTWIYITLFENEAKINLTTVSLCFPLNFSKIKIVSIGSSQIKALVQFLPNESFQPEKEIDQQPSYIGDFKPLYSLTEIAQWKPVVTPYISRVLLKPTKKASPLQAG